MLRRVSDVSNELRSLSIMENSYDDSSLYKLLGESSRKYVWHVAQPKSGSTWLTNILEKLFAEHDMCSERLVPAYGLRPQEIDPRLFITPKKKDVFFRQQHCMYSSYTEFLIKTTKTKVIFQYRNLEDSLASLVDHMDKALNQEEDPEFCKSDYPIGLRSLNKDEIIDYIIDIECPWYCKFLAGWIGSGLLDSMFIVSYEELNKSPFDTLSSLSTHFHFGFTNDQIQNSIDLVSKLSTRKNKGIVGRGRLTFTSSQKARISRYANYFQIPTQFLSSESA